MEHRFQARLQVPTGDLLGDAMRSATVGMPNGRVPPSAFGISTRRTGGARPMQVSADWTGAAVRAAVA
jgi:hypothetical protein